VGDGAKRVLAGKSGSFPSRATALVLEDDDANVLTCAMLALDCRAIDTSDRRKHAFRRDVVSMLWITLGAELDVASSSEFAFVLRRRH
jgi:hypothetical protein